VVCVGIVSGLFVAGCGGGGPKLPPPIEVTGKVTMDGNPSANVEVQFNRISEGGTPEAQSFTATTDASGAFKIEKIYPANYSISVIDRASQQENQAVETGPYQKYGVESPLTAEVSASQHDFTFDLTSK
jgi:hypothetical protein